MHCDVITTIKLINIRITLHSYQVFPRHVFTAPCVKPILFAPPSTECAQASFLHILFLLSVGRSLSSSPPSDRVLFFRQVSSASPYPSALLLAPKQCLLRHVTTACRWPQNSSRSAIIVCCLCLFLIRPSAPRSRDLVFVYVVLKNAYQLKE